MVMRSIYWILGCWRMFAAVMVCGWYWDVRNVNVMADRDDVVTVTRKVNGGRNELAQRMDFLNRAKLILGWL